MSDTLTFWGHYSGQGSYTVVCKQIAMYLHEWLGDRLILGDLRPEGTYGDLPDDYECVAEDEWTAVHQRASMLSVYDGPVRQGTCMVFGFPPWNYRVPKHAVNIGYHVCDVASIPASWVLAMNQMDWIITPSSWCKKVFQDCGVTPPVTVVPHGVTVEPIDGLGPPNDGTFKFLHFCSAEDPTRKGTDVLLRAWDQVKNEMPDATLDIHTDSKLVKAQVDGMEDSRVLLVPQAYTDARGMAWRLQQAHVVVAPSRAEGFGLVPAEALCCGTPVVATTCTGHAETLSFVNSGAYRRGATRGVVFVRHGFLRPCGGQQAMAPEVTEGNIAQSLLLAYRNYGTLRKEALAWKSHTKEVWAWKSVLQKLKDFLSEIGL